MRLTSFAVRVVGSLLSIAAFGPVSGRSEENKTAITSPLKLMHQFDEDGDKSLNPAERKAAREFLRTQRNRTAPSRPKMYREPPKRGPILSPADVEFFPKAPLYDTQVLRTLFLQFDEADWEEELYDFHQTDVEVTAKLIVDGNNYHDVGVHLRGDSTASKIDAGRKRSLGLSLDYVDDEQEISDYRTINLLNSYRDPTFLRTVLYYQIAREYVPAPKASLVRVAINGESWGVYVNAQQFNKDFLRDWFRTSKGARWKVSSGGWFQYLGPDKEKYPRIYEMKSKDDPKAWADLIGLCKVLNQTPANELENALEPLLDIEGTLKFLALENTLLNRDGQWKRGANYSLYEDERGRFHLIPGAADDSMQVPKGPRADEESNPAELDPLAGADDPQKPLLSKLLAVPRLRARYLGCVGAIAEQWLNEKKLGPLVKRYASLIGGDVKADTRKLYSVEDFTSGITLLSQLLQQRGAFLLKHPAVTDARLETEIPESTATR